MRTILEFEEPRPELWQVLDDGVMGGMSRSRISFDGSEALFEGEVSLENQGGFASVRTDLGLTDLGAFDGLAIRAEGQGLRFQLRLRIDADEDGVSYAAGFDAPDGEPKQVRIPFSSFRPTRRGEIVADAPPLDPALVHQLGFLIADGHQGPFRLRVEWVRAYRRR